MIPDLSDRGLVERFGDVMFEIPELFEALRRFEIESRPRSVSGGFKMRGDGMSVKSRGNELGIRIGDTRVKE